MDNSLDASPSQSAIGQGTPQVPSATDPLAERFNKLESRMEQVFQRAKAAEETAKELRSSGGVMSGGATAEDVDMAYLAGKGYSDEEIQRLRTIAKGTDKRLREVTGLPESIAIIEWTRSQNKVAQATPSPSGRVAQTQFKKDWNAMSDDERRNNFESMRDGGG